MLTYLLEDKYGSYLQGVVVSSCSLVLLEELVQVVVQLTPPVFCLAAVPRLLCICLLCLHATLA